MSGCPIHYLEWGDPAAPPVLMTHGFLAHARVFAFVAPWLAERFHLVAFDLSGMGDSGHRETYGDQVEEAMAVAEATRLLHHARKPIFVAHSFGGTVALSAIEQHPDRFGGLVICDLMMMPPERLEPYFRRDPIAQLPPERAMAHNVYPDLATVRARYRLAPPQPCENEFLLEYMARHSARPTEDGGWVWKFDPRILNRRRGVAWWAEVPHRFARLPGRKAVVYGRRSLLFDAGSVAWLPTLTGPGVPLIGVADAHHHLMLDQPLAFSAALEGLLGAWHLGAT